MLRRARATVVGMRASRIAIILAASTALGLAWNAASGRGLALEKSVFLRDGDQEIGVAEAKARLDKGTLFLDARPVEFYKLGHIPGARPLPEDDFDNWFAKLEPILRAQLEVIVYCSGYGCEASHLVARRLKQRGVPALILHQGWPEWQAAGYPERSGDVP